MSAPQTGVTAPSGKHIRHAHRERAAFALRHPGLAWRIVTRREDATGITPAEIARYLPGDPVILEAGACDAVRDGSVPRGGRPPHRRGLYERG